MSHLKEQTHPSNDMIGGRSPIQPPKFSRLGNCQLFSQAHTASSRVEALKIKALDSSGSSPRASVKHTGLYIGIQPNGLSQTGVSPIDATLIQQRQHSNPPVDAEALSQPTPRLGHPITYSFDPFERTGCRLGAERSHGDRKLPLDQHYSIHNRLDSRSSSRADSSPAPLHHHHQMPMVGNLPLQLLNDHGPQYGWRESVDEPITQTSSNLLNGTRTYSRGSVGQQSQNR